ncbi:MAG TPA: CoA-binding protein [Planctomycetota bacterium]|jgi:hypothetical protein|nr:CoA-binding protein [Planctomycetota bacterium]
MPSVAVIGASSDRTKYGNKAVRAYLKHGWTVYPVHPKEKSVEGLRVYASIRDVPPGVDRVALYVPSKVGETLVDDIAAIRPREFFVSPGTESPALIEKAQARGLDPIQACPIVMVGEDPSLL